MSDKPKEIWCDTGLYYDYKEDWSEGSWRNNDNCGGVKYVRSDRIKELEAKLSKSEALLAKAVEALERIEDASRYFGSDPEASETTVRYAHETTRRLCSTTLAELSSVSCANLKGEK